MNSNFQDCLALVLKDEGGYSNNPKDPGGPTNFGITLKDYQLYINKNGTAKDVKSMKVTDAEHIYKAKYWDALNCDDLPSGVDYTCFDYGVNSGVGRPRKALQRFKLMSGTTLIDAINNERTAFLRSLLTFPTFGKGWIARVERVRAYSKVLANKKDVTSGPAAAGLLVAAGTGAGKFWHTHESLIILSSIAVAIIIGAAVHFYRNKGK